MSVDARGDVSEYVPSVPEFQDRLLNGSEEHDMPEDAHLTSKGRAVDVSDLLAEYREALRHLWNTLFRHSGPIDYDSVDAFIEVEKLLFDATVIPCLETRFGRTVIREHLEVVPSAQHGVPVMIENPKEGDRNRYWDHPIRSVRPADVKLRFLGYYDWCSVGIRDFQYYQTEILSFSGHPELRGRQALVEVGHAAVSLSCPE